MPARKRKAPDTLTVLRYDSRSGRLRVIVGDRRRRLHRGELAELAASALRDRTFVCHASKDEPALPGDQVCFIPHGDECEVLAVYTDGWQRHHGDHRRSLLEILNDIAAAVARGSLHFLDDHELAVELGRGREVLTFSIDDSGSLARARAAVLLAMESHGVPAAERRRMTLCVSEATSNILQHGGGSGSMSLRLLDYRLRAVVADRGPGLDFVNWTSPGNSAGQTSMGYGYKLILDNLDEVYLHTGTEGTTLILDVTV